MTPALRMAGRRRFTAVALAASALVAAAGFTATPAHSAPDPGCRTPYPVANLTAGQDVTGKTVTQGTDPGTFTGSVQGVLEDGIAPGVDMILIDLHSATIDKVGIWEGMSGSPVYAADGSLIGAVSYGLSTGPSTIAGVTPATEMAKLLTHRGSTSASGARTAALSPTLRTRLVRSGAASAAEVSHGMTRLRTPYTLSGLNDTRLAKLSRVLDFGGGHFTAGSGGPTSQEPIDIQAGGNLAASESYGTVTAAGLGTATMVCGDEVVGFGHPMDFTGPSTMSLHGARTVLIQDDPTIAGFKVANLGAPVGTVDNDRLAGIHGVKGALPESSDITSQVTDGAERASGTTHVTVPDMVTDLDFTHLLAVQDRVLDRIGKGTAEAHWTINGERADGTPFSVTRNNTYADPFDISAATGIALTDDLLALQENGGETVKITSVHTRTTMHSYYEAYTIAKVQGWQFGKWRTVSGRHPAAFRAGRLAKLKVRLTSAQAPARELRMAVKVPLHAAGRIGSLNVVGGSVDSEFSDFFFDEGFDAFDFSAPSSSTFPRVLKNLTTGLQNNQVRATLRFRHAPKPSNAPRTKIKQIDRVVGGRVSAPVFALD